MMSRLLKIAVAVFFVYAVSLAQSSIPPDVEMKQLLWTGAFAEKTGLIDKMPMNTDADLERKNAFRGVHGIIVENKTEKVITAIEWSFIVIFERPDYSPSNPATRPKIMLLTSVRQKGLSVAPKSTRLLAGAVPWPNTFDLKLNLTLDASICGSKHCYHARATLDRIEFSDGSYWQRPTIPSVDIQRLIEERGMEKDEERILELEVHKPIIDLLTRGEFAAPKR